MGKRITYDINGQYFANQKELKAYIKNLKTCPREIEGEEFDLKMVGWKKGLDIFMICEQP